MGIRFHCNFCEKRLNVKAKQAGEFCICPDCENEIRIPLESTIAPKLKKRKKKPHGKSFSEVDISPPAAEANSIELSPVPDEPPTIVAAGPSIVSVTPVKPVAGAAHIANSNDETLVDQVEYNDSTSDLFGGDESLDSDAALDQLLGADEREISDETSEESESFLLAKPVAKVGDNPLKANPDLVWYLRHKRLGEKGPLRAQQVEKMLENGQIRAGFIVWREDWNDWVPAEEVFPSLATVASGGPGYEIPQELNPHSEASRKKRAQRRFWLCFNAATFLLVIVLVYWITQFGSS